SDERADQLAGLAGLRREGVAAVPNGVDIAAALGLSAAGARLAERLDLYRADPLLGPPARLTRRHRVEAGIAATAAPRGRGRAAPPSDRLQRSSPLARPSRRRRDLRAAERLGRDHRRRDRAFAGAAAATLPFASASDGLVARARRTCGPARA